MLRSIARKEWSSALGVFSALKHVILLQPDIDRACDAVQRQQLSGVLLKLQQTVCGLMAEKCFLLNDNPNFVGYKSVGSIFGIGQR